MLEPHFAFTELLVKEAVPSSPCCSRKVLIVQFFLMSLGFVVLLNTALCTDNRSRQNPAVQELAVNMASAPWFTALVRSPQLPPWPATLGRNPNYVPVSSSVIPCPPGVSSLVCHGMNDAGGPPNTRSQGGGRGAGGWTRPPKFDRPKPSFTSQPNFRRPRFNQPVSTVDNRPGFRDAPQPKRGQKAPSVVMNLGIKYPEVRVMAQDMSPLGVMPTNEALVKAQEDEKDLIVITPNAQPPVVKIVEYSKYKYELDKGQKEAKRKQRESRVDTKEVKMRVNIDTNDYGVKLRKADKFLTKDGDKVKVLVQMKGAEMYKTNGKELLQKFKEDIGEKAVIETEPRQQGRSWFMVLGPAKAS